MDDDVAMLERLVAYATPDGWKLRLTYGWTSAAATGGAQLPDAPAAFSGDLHSEEATVEWSGRRFPAFFQMTVSVPSEDGGRGWMLWFGLSPVDHRATLYGVLGTRDVDQALTELLKLRPLEWWKTKALVQLAQQQLYVELEGVTEDPTDQEFLSMLSRAVTPPLSVSQGRRNNRITDDLLRDVASVYREALRVGRPPTKAVEEEFHTSRPNAAKWVKRARAAGHLGPAIGTRAGEADPSDE